VHADASIAIGTKVRSSADSSHGDTKVESRGAQAESCANSARHCKQRTTRPDLRLWGGNSTAPRCPVTLRTSAFSVPIEVRNGGGCCRRWRRSEHGRHSCGCHGIRSQPRDKPDRVDPDTVAAARLWEAATEVFSCEPGPSSSAEQQHDRVAAVEPARGTSDQPTAQTSWSAAICTRRPAVRSTAQAAGLVGPPIERVGHLLVAPRPEPG